MNRIYRLIFVSACLTVASGVQAADFCSLTIFVRTSNGVPTNSAISVYDESGGLFISTTAVNGVARICDLGFSRYRVEIGDTRRCDHVTLTNVIDRWPKEQKLSVIETLCFDDPVVPPSGCPVFLRVLDKSGKPIQGARFTVSGGAPVLSDQYGRVLTAMLLEKTYFFTLSASDYVPESFNLSCERTGFVIRKQIVMKQSEAP